jgi:uncharacterized SAM-binding protein YcdF (DUF218 family)
VTSQPTPGRGGRAAAGLAAGALCGFLMRDLGLTGLASYRGDSIALVLLGALLGVLLWGTALRRALLGLVSGLAGLWLLVAFTPLSALLADGLPRRDAEEPADAVFVLASRIQPDGTLTATALSRLVHGLELIGRGRAPRLLLSELHPPDRSYAAVARPIMQHLGITADVLTVGPVGNTRDEAVAVGALCRQRGWRRLLVVTSPLHSRRACAALEREGVVVLSSPAPEIRYDETLAWPSSRLFAFSSALHERIGLWLYRRRGWLAASPAD